MALRRYCHIYAEYLHSLEPDNNPFVIHESILVYLVRRKGDIRSDAGAVLLSIFTLQKVSSA